MSIWTKLFGGTKANQTPQTNAPTPPPAPVVPKAAQSGGGKSDTNASQGKYSAQIQDEFHKLYLQALMLQGMKKAMGGQEISDAESVNHIFYHAGLVLKPKYNLTDADIVALFDLDLKR